MNPPADNDAVVGRVVNQVVGDPILAALPNSHSVSEHSIIGTRGKSGPLKNSTDGVVAYGSSHLDRAASEKIVPAPHHAIDHEESVIEIRRLLSLPR